MSAITTATEVTTKRILVQFKLRASPTDEVVRGLPDETLTEAAPRWKQRKAYPTPEQRFRHTGGIPRTLLEVLRKEGFVLVDAWHQKRLSLGFEAEINDHILVTFEFGRESKNSPERKKELETNGVGVLEKKFLSERYQEIRVTSFPNNPDLLSFLFIGKAQHPLRPQPIEDENAQRFGVEITRRIQEVHTKKK